MKIIDSIKNCCGKRAVIAPPTNQSKPQSTIIASQAKAASTVALNTITLVQPTITTTPPVLAFTPPALQIPSGEEPTSVNYEVDVVTREKYSVSIPMPFKGVVQSIALTEARIAPEDSEGQDRIVLKTRRVASQRSKTTKSLSAHNGCLAHKKLGAIQQATAHIVSKTRKVELRSADMHLRSGRALQFQPTLIGLRYHARPLRA